MRSQYKVQPFDSASLSLRARVQSAESRVIVGLRKNSIERYHARKMKRKLLIVAQLLVLGGSPLWGDGAGSTSANFMKIGIGARPVAMGEAFTAVADDVNAVSWNPAGMMLSRGLGLTSTHSEWFEGIKHEFFGYSQRLGVMGAMGASVTYLTSGKFLQTLETPSGEYAGTGKEVKATDFAVSAAYAQRLGLWWGGGFFKRSLVGIKATIVGQKAVRISDYGASFDLGYIYEVVRKRFYVGGVLLNAGTRIRDSSQPLIFKLGAAYKQKKLMYDRDALILAVETDGHIDTGVKFNVGSEYKAGFTDRQYGAVRAGYRIGGDLGGLSGLTTGAGYGFGFGVVDASIDYAFVPYGVLGNTHRVSLNMRIGGRPVPPKAFLDAKPEFSPEDETLKLKLKTKGEEDITKWTVIIRACDGEEVKKFEGEGEVPSDLPWDGKDKDGKLVEGGEYCMDLEVEDEEEQKGKSKERMVLAKLKPRPTAMPTPVPTAEPEEKFKYPYAFQFSTDLLFESGRAELKPEAVQALEEALAIIRVHFPDSLFLVEGHTDNIQPRAGSRFANNEQLSLSRALAVQTMIVTRGILAPRTQILGFGSSQPVATNDTPEGRGANRRVEMIVYGEKEVHQDEFIRDMTALVRQGSYEKAADDLLRAAYVYPRDPRVYKLLGACFYSLGEEARARESFERSLQLNPGDEELRGYLEK